METAHERLVGLVAGPPYSSRDVPAQTLVTTMARTRVLDANHKGRRNWGEGRRRKKVWERKEEEGVALLGLRPSGEYIWDYYLFIWVLLPAQNIGQALVRF